MPRVTAPPLPEHCPWGGFTPPNVDWCEEQLCSWVVNPADTWSNLLYIAVGLWMWRDARAAFRAGMRGNAMLPFFGPTCVAVGVFSLVYHASYTYFLQFFDFVGMFLFCFAVITANGLRLRWFEPSGQLRFFAAGVIGFSALVLVLAETSFPIQALIGILVAAILGQEILISRAKPATSHPRSFWLALLLLAGAALASLADVTRSWCDPSNHWLQGHSLWHLLSAAALLSLYHFYRGLPEGGLEESEPGESASV